MVVAACFQRLYGVIIKHADSEYDIINNIICGCLLFTSYKKVNKLTLSFQILISFEVICTYSIISLVRTPGDRRNLFALSVIRINRCLKY